MFLFVFEYFLRILTQVQVYGRFSEYLHLQKQRTNCSYVKNAFSGVKLDGVFTYVMRILIYLEDYLLLKGLSHKK